jgi:hypothetical protein
MAARPNFVLKKFYSKSSKSNLPLVMTCNVRDPRRTNSCLKGAVATAPCLRHNCHVLTPKYNAPLSSDLYLFVHIFTAKLIYIICVYSIYAAKLTGDQAPPAFIEADCRHCSVVAQFRALGVVRRIICGYFV